MELKVANPSPMAHAIVPHVSDVMNRRLEAKFVEARELAKLDENQRQLYKLLCALRKQLALEDSVPSYQVFSNQVAINLCVEKPTIPDALARVKGLGPAKIRAYGDLLIAVIRRFIAS